MKSTFITTIAAFSTLITAFPTIALEAAQLAARNSDFSTATKAAHEKRLNGILPGFNAAEQLIDVSGEHAFIPPDFGAGDLRGPYPGLNTLANHNYLPHNPLSLTPGWSIGGPPSTVSEQNLLGNILGLLGHQTDSLALTINTKPTPP